MKPLNKVVWSMIAAVSIAGGSYLGSMELSHSAARADSPAATAKPTQEPSHETLAPAVDLSRAFRAVHNSVKDAVVNIHIVKKGTTIRNSRLNNLPPGFSLPPGFNLPDNNGDDNGDNGGADGGKIEGTGSGVIVSPDGYILTNNHVVEGADTISIHLDDGRRLKAKIIGTDPKTDLAVVKIDADHLTYAQFGDSDEIQVGDWVLAFGSPFNFEETMTQGIISAKGRQIDIIREHNPSLQGLTYENFLQTDAAINPGNSGGPLVNLKGEIVGINAAIASNTGAYNGIGFSIPSNDARYIMDSLIKHGKVVRGYLGVMIGDIHNAEDPQTMALVDAAKKAGLSSDRGALVSGITPDSPGAKGGLELGDIIIGMNDKAVQSMNELRNQIGRTAPGTTIKLQVFRDGKTQDVSFAVGTQPDMNALAASGGGNDEVQSPVATDEKALGIRVQTVDPDLVRKYHLRNSGGVIVTELSPTGLGAQSGIGLGDVITSVNGKKIDNADTFTNAMAKANISDGVKFVLRGADGMQRLVFITKK